MTKLFGLVCVVALVACGGGGGGLSPKEGCNQGVEALCAQIYTCYSAEELAAAGYPASEAACVTAGQANAGCSAQTTDNACTGNETYHSDKASDCVDQIMGLECSQVRDPAFDVNVAAPACNQVCAVD